MPVHPEIQPFLSLINDPSRPTAADQGPDAVRTAYGIFMAMGGAPEPSVHTEDSTIPGPSGDISIRIYRPTEIATTDPAPACLVWVHGGGWTIGNIETDNTRCSQMAARAGVVVVSVDYRLAPEHPYPAALDDTVAAVQWVHMHADDLGIDASRIALGGDSAGGNLTAAAAQVLRDVANAAGTVHPLAFQLMVYPAVDSRGDYPSMRDNASGYYLTKDSMDWFEAQYDAGRNTADPGRNPLLGNLAGLPRAHVLTCEFDPLRDEGAAYVAALRQAGVATTHTLFDGMIHAAFGMEGLWPATRSLMDDAVSALRNALTPANP